MICRRNAAIWFSGIVSAGILACLSYELGWAPPMSIAVALFAVGLFVLLAHGAGGGLFLSRYVALIYALPFVHSLEYVVRSPAFLNEPFIWGLAANDYQRDLAIVARMTLVGAIGALGLAAGLVAAFAFTNRPARPLARRALGWPSITAISLLAVLLSWVNAPVDVITRAAYTESQNLLTGTNFNAAYLLSYVFVGAVAVDIVLEKRIRRRRIKKMILAALVLVIVGWFQFARGDRESLGLVGGLAVLGLDQYRKSRHVIRRAVGVGLVAVLMAGVFMAGQYVGAIRSQASTQRLELALRNTGADFFHGTWSAALMTPLSIVGDADHGLMKLRWGRTYVDYLLSIPPGPVAAAIGYARPIEGTRGPAWEMRYGLGGTHIVVVPFMNFRSFGVLFILMAYGLMFGWSQVRAAGGGFVTRLWYFSLAMGAPFYLWYGEMSLVRTWMSFWLVVVVVFSLRMLSRGAMQQKDEPADTNPSIVGQMLDGPHAPESPNCR